MSIASAARHVPAAPALRCPSATGKRFRACARLSGPSASRCRWMRITPTTPMASPACPLSSRWQAVAQRHGGRWQKEWTAPGAAARQTSRPETRPGWRRQWQGEASRRKPAGPPGRHGPAEAPERPRFAELADGRHWLTTSPQGQTRLRPKKGADRITFPVGPFFCALVPGHGTAGPRRVPSSCVVVSYAAMRSRVFNARLTGVGLARMSSTGQ